MTTAPPPPPDPAERPPRHPRHPASRSSAASPPGWPGTSALPVLWVRAGVRARGAARRPRHRSSTPACGWCCRRTRRFETEAPGLESATRGGRRPGRIRRLGDVGPAIALAALGFGGDAAASRRSSAAARSSGRSLLGVVGVALLWRQADEAQRERWLDTTGRIDPVRVVLGNGGWASYARLAAGVGADRARAGALRRSAAARSPMARDVIVAAAARRRRHRDRGRAVGLPARLRPHRRARRAGAHPGARRRRRAPARLGAADARADPEERRRRRHGRPAGPRPGARPALLAVRRRSRPTRAPSPSALRGAAAAVEDAHGVSVDVVDRRRLRPRRGAAADRRRDRRGGDQRRQARRHRPGRRVRRGVDRRGRRVRPRPRPGLRPGRPCPPTGTAYATASSTGWSATAASAEVRSAPGEGTEVRLHLPRQRPEPRQEDRA